MNVPTTPTTTTRVHTVVPSPIGPVTLIATDGVLSALYMDAHRHAPEESAWGPREASAAVFGPVSEQLAAYFVGDLTTFDLPLAPIGTPFQTTVWAALREIPYAETITYRELATRVGNPAASRAVGLANGRNPISIVVPCHRVIGADGSMTGYGGGIERKTFLLDHERRVGGLTLM